MDDDITPATVTVIQEGLCYSITFKGDFYMTNNPGPAKLSDTISLKITDTGNATQLNITVELIEARTVSNALQPSLFVWRNGKALQMCQQQSNTKWTSPKWSLESSKTLDDAQSTWNE